MHSIVDGTTVAMGVEVCSFYLADHEHTRLTLAATNGLDRSQVGKVSLAWGQGITGRVAASREPIAVEDVTLDDRFAWVRGFDIEALTGMLSVPLEWHDQVVGVLNVQTREPRVFGEEEIGFLRTIAALLAGHRREGPADRRGRGAARPADRAGRGPRGAALGRDPRPADAAVGGPRLRRPAGRRGDRGDAAARRRRPPRRGGRAADDQLAPARPAGGLDPGVGPRRRADRALAGAVRCGRGGRRDRRDAAAPAAAAPDPLGAAGGRRIVAIGDDTRFRQVLEQLLENESKYAPTDEGVSIGIWRRRRRDPGLRHRRRPGRPARGLGERLRAVRAGRGARRGRAARGSGCSRRAG